LKFGEVFLHEGAHGIAFMEYTIGSAAMVSDNIAPRGMSLTLTHKYIGVAEKP